MSLVFYSTLAACATMTGVIIGHLAGAYVDNQERKFLKMYSGYKPVFTNARRANRLIVEQDDEPTILINIIHQAPANIIVTHLKEYINMYDKNIVLETDRRGRTCLMHAFLRAQNDPEIPILDIVKCLLAFVDDPTAFIKMVSINGENVLQYATYTAEPLGGELAAGAGNGPDGPLPLIRSSRQATSRPSACVVERSSTSVACPRTHGAPCPLDIRAIKLLLTGSDLANL